MSFDCEVFGLFSALIPQGPRRQALDEDTWRASRERQGLVPDFKIDCAHISEKGGFGIRGASSALAELKFIHLGVSRYPDSVVGGGRHCHGVSLRAREVQREMDSKAKVCDEFYGNTQPGDVGPVRQRLRSFGPTLPLVVGHFGEWNEGFQVLLSALAEDAAPRMAALFGASSQRAAKTSIHFFAKRQLAWAGLLANARLKLARSAYIGPTWAAAALRREQRAQADDQSRARCRDSAAHRASFASGFSHAPHQRGAAFGG